jgi:hypothetical protein
VLGCTAGSGQFTGKLFTNITSLQGCADDAKVCSNVHLLEGIHVSELRIRSLENVMSLEEANKVVRQT